MNETQQVSTLIGDIYDAALDPVQWTRVLEQTCGYVEGCAASLLSQDSAYRSGKFYFSWGDDPHYTKLYFDEYIKINPLLVPTIVDAKVGQVASILSLIPNAEYFASRFYKEWAQPQGYLDSAHAVLDKSSTSYVAVAVARHDRNGMVDDEARRRMGLLVPHFRRAVTIGKVVDLQKVEVAALSDTLDGLAAATILVDANGRIVHANISGHALLADGAILRNVNGKLSSTDPQIDRTLHDVFSAAGRGDLEVGIKSIALPLRQHEGERWLAHILPLTSGARRKAGTEYSAVAALFVRKAGLDLPHPLEVLADTYKLTPTEMRVLMAIVQIGGVPEIAPVLGIAETTVKTHLARLFAKTDTSRQADLVKLVAGYMSPLAGPLRS